MKENPVILIDEFICTHKEVFTLDEFYHEMKKKGIKLTKNDAKEVLYASDFIFPLVNGEFITRAGVFTGRWFSIMPTKEEIQKDHLVIGHRALPFLNPEIAPDRVCIVTSTDVIPPEKCIFSMNFATDVFSMYGEGFVLPYIFGDHSNEKLTLASIQYSMPTEIQLTGWSISEIAGKKGFQYGDRLLCKISDWKEGIIYVEVVKGTDSSSISFADIERDEWYSTFEKSILASIRKNGPASSIEEQLAFLYLENQEELCTPTCASIEEFFKRTKKLCFAQFGVETRIWETGQDIPFAGEWNKDASTEILYGQSGMLFSPKVMDAFILNYYADIKNHDVNKSLDDLIDDIFPFSSSFNTSERKIITEQIQKRSPYLIAQSEFYDDKRITSLRKTIVELYAQVNRLVCQISKSGLKLSELPSQELIILMQLFSHMFKIIEEMETSPVKDQLPIDELVLSLEGMEETFYEVQGILKNSLDAHAVNDITIVE